MSPFLAKGAHFCQKKITTGLKSDAKSDALPVYFADMAVAWVPILLVFFVFVVLFTGIYVYKHKKEFMREIFPDLADPDKKKKPRNPRPNARRYPKQNPNRPVAPDPVVSRKPKPPPKHAKSEEDEDDDRISDITIDTEKSPLASMTISPNGRLLICAGQDRSAFLFAINCLELPMYPLDQHFTVLDSEITQLITIQPDVDSDGPIETKSQLRVVYNNHRRKTIESGAVLFDDEVKAYVSPFPFTTQSYHSSIQKLCTSPRSDRIALVTDRQLIRILDHTGKQLFEYILPDKKCHDAVVTAAFDRLIIAYGAAVQVFAIEEEIIFQGAVSLPAQVLSVTYSETRHQIIAACAGGLVLVLKKDISQGPAMRFNSTGARIVRASPKTDFLAIIAKRTKMQIVNLESGMLSNQLDTVHNGEVHFLEWSAAGTWIFVASKTEPNIECFHMSPATGK
jgi:WD40 repeat protein